MDGVSRATSRSEDRPLERSGGSDPPLAAQPLAPVRFPWDGDSEDADGAEARLAQLGGALGPLRRAFAALAERLVGTKAYERLCYARLSDYARERLGLSARQIQELARVHRALAGLSGLERALVSNELPWSKVRLIARVATAEDEAAWIARARVMSTRRLEREVRETGQSAEDEGLIETQPDQRVQVRCTPAVREKWSLVCEVAERVAGQRLRSGEVLEFVAAEVFSTLSIDPAFSETSHAPPAPRRDVSTDGQPGEATPAIRTPSPDLPLRVAALAAGLACVGAFELDRRLRCAVRLEQTLDAAIAPLLRRVTSAEYEWQTDYQTLAYFAREQLGMSASKARALLRLERAGDVCPELRDAYRRGLISWVKAQCLLPLFLLELDGEWRPVWLAWAERVTVRRLEQDVERALLLRAGHDFAWHRCKFHPERAQDAIPPAERQLCAPDIDTEATQQLAWRVPREVAQLFFGVKETLRSRLETDRTGFPSDGELLDGMLDRALLAWTLRDPAARRPDRVIERDGYRCAVPGCSSRSNLHVHHITFRSAGGSNTPSNRITLCAFHHQRCLHTGLLRVHGCAPQALVFELGLRSAAPPLARYCSGDIAIPQIETRAHSPRAA